MLNGLEVPEGMRCLLKVLESIRGVVEVLEAMRRVLEVLGAVRQVVEVLEVGHATCAVGAGGCGGYGTCIPWC
jgi:hypothetical protein